MYFMFFNYLSTLYWTGVVKHKIQTSYLYVKSETVKLWLGNWSCTYLGTLYFKVKLNSDSKYGYQVLESSADV